MRAEEPPIDPICGREVMRKSSHGEMLTSEEQAYLEQMPVSTRDGQHRTRRQWSVHPIGAERDAVNRIRMHERRDEQRDVLGEQQRRAPDVNEERESFHGAITMRNPVIAKASVGLRVAARQFRTTAAFAV